MTKQVRDWQEDIKLVEAYKHAQTLHNIPYPRKLSWEDNLSEPTELFVNGKSASRILALIVLASTRRRKEMNSNDAQSLSHS